MLLLEKDLDKDFYKYYHFTIIYIFVYKIVTKYANN